MWGNPYKIAKDGNRSEVIQKFARYLETSGLKKFVGELRGYELVCYCSPDEECHGDVLIRMADSGVEKDAKVPPLLGRPDYLIQTSDVVKEKPNVPPLFQDGLMDSEDYIPSGLLDKWAEEQDNRGDHPGQVSDWEGHRGVGPPRRSEFLGAVKAFADGGGLCSPGR